MLLSYALLLRSSVDYYIIHLLLYVLGHFCGEKVGPTTLSVDVSPIGCRGISRSSSMIIFSLPSA